MVLQALLEPPWDTGSEAGALSPSCPTFRFERVSGDLPGQQITSGDGPIQVVKERRNAEFRLQEAKASLRCLRKRLWLRRYEGSARPGSDGVAVELGAPVEEGAVLRYACAFLGCSGSNNMVLLGGQHRQVQALLKCATAAGIAVELVRNAGNYLVGAMRGSGKNALGHGTFAPVDG